MDKKEYKVVRVLQVFFMTASFLIGIFSGFFANNIYVKNKTVNKKDLAEACKLEESRAIEGCEVAANEIHRQLYATEQQLVECDESYEAWKIEAKLWKARAYKCAEVLRSFSKETQ